MHIYFLFVLHGDCALFISPFCLSHFLFRSPHLFFFSLYIIFIYLYFPRCRFSVSFLVLPFPRTFSFSSPPHSVFFRYSSISSSIFRSSRCFVVFSLFTSSRSSRGYFALSSPLFYLPDSLPRFARTCLYTSEREYFVYPVLSQFFEFCGPPFRSFSLPPLSKKP